MFSSLLTLLDNTDRESYIASLPVQLWAQWCSAEPLLQQFASPRSLASHFETRGVDDKKAQVFSALLRIASSPHGETAATLIVMIMQPLGARLTKLAADNNWDVTAHDVQVTMWLTARQARPSHWRAPLATYALNVKRQLSDEWRATRHVTPYDPTAISERLPAAPDDAEPDLAAVLEEALAAGLSPQHADLLQRIGSKDKGSVYVHVAQELGVHPRTVSRRTRQAIRATQDALGTAA